MKYDDDRAVFLQVLQYQVHKKNFNAMIYFGTGYDI